MRARPVALILAAAAALGACHKAAPEVIAGPASSAALANAGCPSGATKVLALGFCIVLPPGYAVSAVTEDEPGKLKAAFARASGVADRFVVRATDDTLANVDDSLLDPARNHVKGKGEIQGGQGKWFYSTPRAGKGAAIGVYVQGPKRLFTCERAASDDGPELQRTLDICKTITPLALR